MSEAPTPSAGADRDVVEFADLLRALWRRKWLAMGITFGCALVALLVALMLPNVYRAEALLAPNGEEGASGLSSLAAQYGGLASLAGINLGSEGSDKTVMGLEILKSRQFISDFIRRHDALVPLMAADAWDPETGKLLVDAAEYDEAQKQWVRDVRPPKTTVPSMQEAYEEFAKRMTVRQDPETGFVTVAVEHLSPQIAKQWVDWLVQDINSTVMHKEVDEATQSIAYLEKQVESTSLAELQSVFFRMIEEQMKTIMLAEVSDEYLLQTLDPAVVPEEKAKPRRLLILIFGTFLGMMLGVVVSLALPARRD